MTRVQTEQIKQALESMFYNIKMKENIAQNLAEIERLRKEVQSTAPAQLNHFLERRSYTKALAILYPKAPINQPVYLVRQGFLFLHHDLFFVRKDPTLQIGNQVI